MKDDESGALLVAVEPGVRGEAAVGFTGHTDDQRPRIVMVGVPTLEYRGPLEARGAGQLEGGTDRGPVLSRRWWRGGDGAECVHPVATEIVC